MDRTQGQRSGTAFLRGRRGHDRRGVGALGVGRSSVVRSGAEDERVMDVGLEPRRLEPWDRRASALTGG